MRNSELHLHDYHKVVGSLSVVSVEGRESLILDIPSQFLYSTLNLSLSSPCDYWKMESATGQNAPKGYNNYWVGLDDMKYVPPYLKDVPETPTEMTCVTTGNWPTWIQGSLMR